jgi:hypothetical protein
VWPPTICCNVLPVQEALAALTMKPPLLRDLLRALKGLASLRQVGAGLYSCRLSCSPENHNSQLALLLCACSCALTVAGCAHHSYAQYVAVCLL